MHVAREENNTEYYGGVTLEVRCEFSLHEVLDKA